MFVLILNECDLLVIELKLRVDIILLNIDKNGFLELRKIMVLYLRCNVKNFVVSVYGCVILFLICKVVWFFC